MTYDRTLIVIRERSFLDLLDLALLVVRDRPIVLGLTALVGIAPVCRTQCLAVDRHQAGRWALGLAPADGNTLGYRPVNPRSGRLDVWGASPAGQVVKTLIVSSPALFFTQVWVRGVLLLFCIGCFLVPARFSFVNETLLLERWGRSRA